ncbi:hypothetical protein OLX02_00805 [Novosphingobium sp. KCTC 2891]|uniref:beta strand repeat-containing protein n=1 Tax=Novosphingobium sp. KCTC 2891 TaxID=2989730 RepID=UPI00222382F8|nr:calcium-binding protein [Novosphingobium sp. KCTC 2891]MCW1381351.1 hypothetical protein [Novosphingobium sp. KCTC 2891]
MATYIGTNGDETLIGTSDSDTFVPMLGFDVVEGGGGSDTLVLDYTGLLAATRFSFGTGAGAVEVVEYLGGLTTYLQYSGISTASAALSDGDDEATVGVASILAGASLNIDGGLGTDRLILDFAGLPGATFALDALGQVPALYGTYTGFENYTVKLAGGINAVTLGAGDDDVWSNGGVDAIDGGDGLNRWYGDYSATTTDLAITANGATNTASLSNGTTIANFDHGDIVSGSGNDTFTLTNSQFSVQGGTGVDTLIERFSGTHNSYGEGGSNSSIATDADGFSGQFHDDGGYFSGIEKLDIVLGDEDKTIYLNIDGPMFTGASLKLDAGLGANTFRVYAPAVTDTTLVLAADGSISSSLGTLSHFGIFDLNLGGGVNTITTGAGYDRISVVGSGNNTISSGDGDDIVHTRGGTATIDMGSGFDSLTIDNRSDARGQTYAINLGPQTIADSRIEGVELLRLTGSAGVDSFSVGSGITDGDIQGSGNDAFYANFAGTLGTGTFSGYISTGQYGISGQISGLRGANDRLSFGSMDKVDITFNDSDNEFRVYGYGASQNPARMRLDGGLGNDTITIFGEAAGYSAVKNGTGGYVVVDIDPSDEIVPEFTVTNFEHLHIQGQATDTVIDLPAYGAGVNTSGSVGNDTITGTEYADTLSGLAGNDTLLGLGGNDVLNGGAGDDKIDGGDVISGGLGADILTGGRGADVFVFDVLETSANRDMIRDFTHGTDKIELDHAVFAGLSSVAAYPGSLAASDFTIGKAATTASHHIIYNAGNGQLFYDADGVGGAAQVQIAMLQGKPVLSAGDFLVI